jgi:hypothetical protein
MVAQVDGNLRRYVEVQNTTSHTDIDTNVYVQFCYHQVFVNTTDHYKRQDMTNEIIHTHAAMKRMGFKYPHFVDIADVDSTNVERLRSEGLHVTDRTELIPYFKSIWHPEYDLKKAQMRGKRVTGKKGVPHDVQGRTDGWATYFKFLAWRTFQCKKVLSFDADVHFDEGIIRRLQSATFEEAFFNGTEEEFSADREKGARGYDGLNVHAMILTPSQATYDLFIRTANSSDFSPYTQCEQDVIESLVADGRFNLTSDRVKTIPFEHRPANGSIPWVTTLGQEDIASLTLQAAQSSAER